MTSTNQAYIGYSRSRDPHDTSLLASLFAISFCSRGQPNKLPLKMSTVAFDSRSVEGGIPDSRFTVRFRERDGGVSESTRTPDSLFDDKSTVTKVELETKICRDKGMSPNDRYI